MNLRLEKSISLLIPDGESHLLFYVLSCLSEVNNLKVHVMSNSKHDPMKYSRLIKSYTYYPSVSHEEEWISHINNKLSKNKIDVIMPIFENGIRSIIKHKKNIQHPYRLVSLPSLSSFDTAIDKWKLKLHLEKHKLPYPKSIYINTRENIDDIPLSFPIIGKPTKGYGGGMGVFLFTKRTELLSFINKPHIPNHYLLQEYIEGEDYCCNVLCKDGEILAFTIQKGTIWGEKKLGPQLGYEFIMKQKIYSLSILLMKSLNWSGVACIDLRYDYRTDTFYIIEINTRFWSSLLGSLAAGVNFPALLIQDALGQSLPEKKFNQVKSVNLKGLIELLKNEPKVFFNIKFLWQKTPLKYALKDPVPMAYKYFSRTKNIIVRNIKTKRATHKENSVKN